MIKVVWPVVGSLIDDEIICDWLENLVAQDRTTIVFEISHGGTEIYFTREDDAIAFKIKFGL